MRCAMRHGLLLAALCGAGGAISNAQCAAKLAWFKRVNHQVEADPDGIGEADPLFAAKMSSISKNGAECGDTASDQHEDCSKYDNWATFQAVAKNQKREFRIFDGDAKFTDVSQGALGDCYFLAALASIAHSDPDFIHDMFLKKDEWANDVYTSRWRLNGGDFEVAVNNEVPTIYHDRYTAFAHGNEDNKKTFVGWPIILEKAWAKIYGNYRATEGGMWGTVLASAAAANVISAMHKDSDADSVWSLLMKGHSNNWPMGAGSCKAANKYGMVSDHAYSVLKATHIDGARTVTCFNPHNADGYNGTIPNENKKDGFFTMTLEEYMDAFDTTQVAELRKGYKTRSKRIAGDKGVMQGQYEITITGDSAFAVGVYWPSSHLVKPCQVPDPEVTLLVGNKNGFDKITIGNEHGRHSGINVARAEVKSGPGTYVIVVSTKFQDTGVWVPDVQLTVYAEEKVDITESDMQRDKAIDAMILPKCDGDEITVTGKDHRSNGLFKRADNTLRGVPYFVSVDDDTYMFFEGARGHWTFISRVQWPDVKLGRHFDTPGYNRDELGECGMKDSAQVYGFKSTTCDDVIAQKNAWLVCEGAKYSKTAQRFCPVACAQAKKDAEVLKKDPSAVLPKCNGDDITVSGKEQRWNGLFTKADKTLKGVPYYVAVDGDAYMFYNGARKHWTFISRGHWPDVKDGAHFDTPGYNRDELGECGMKDSAQVYGFTSTTCDDVIAQKNAWLVCEGAKYSKIARRYCPVACAQAKKDAEVLKKDPSAVLPKCDEGTVLGYSKFKDGLYRKDAEKLHSIPVYKSIDGGYVMYFKASCKGLTFIGTNQWADVLGGADYNTPCYSKSKFKCGRHDTDEIAFATEPCSVVPAKKYSNVNCKDIRVQNYCAETCADSIQAFDASVTALGGRFTTVDEMLSTKILGLGVVMLLSATLGFARNRFICRLTSIGRAESSIGELAVAPMLDPEDHQIDQ